MTQPDTAARSGDDVGPPQNPVRPDVIDAPPGGPGAALIEVFICSGFPTQLAIALILSGLGMAATGVEGGLSFAYVATLSLADAVVVCGLVVYFLHAHGESVRELVIGPRPIAREVGLGILLIPVLVVAAIGGLLLIRTLAPSLHNVPANPLESMLSTPARAVFFGLVVVIAGGAREELQRAFVLRRFEQHLGGGWFGLVVFSAAFGLGHYVQGWDAAIMTGLLGAVWGAFFLVRRNAVVSIVSHSGFNLVEIALAVTAAQAI